MSPICLATVIRSVSGSVMVLALRYAMAMPSPSAERVLNSATSMVAVAAVSSDLRRTSRIFLLSWSATSRYSVELLIQADASFCK